MDVDMQALPSTIGAASGNNDGLDDEVLTHNPGPDDPRTWKAGNELKMFMEPIDAEGGGDDGRWEDGVVFIKMDQVMRPGYALVDDTHRGQRAGWVPIEHLQGGLGAGNN